jgi:hypothetical protein
VTGTGDVPRHGDVAGTGDVSRPEDLLAGHPVALEVLSRVRELLDALGPYDMRVFRSQIAFRRRRGFAYLWRPGQYLSGPVAEVVLSVVLGRQDPSPRWKQVVHPSPAHWMHHLELRGTAELDEEVGDWLREAYDRAA